MVSRLKAVRYPLNLFQLAENLELSKEQTYEAAFRAEIVQKNDCPCILLTGFGFIPCLHLRYTELYYIRLVSVV